MSKKSEFDINNVIQDNLKTIEDPELIEHPELNDILNRKYDSEIKTLVDSLANQLFEVEEFIIQLRIHTKSVTEQTNINAQYLLGSSIISYFKSIIELQKINSYSPIMILLRSTEEAIKLCHLLNIDAKEGHTENLTEWYSGKIVGDAAARRKIADTIDDNDINAAAIDIKGMKSYIYQMTSQYTHNGYVGILENINPFTKDIDYNGLASKYRITSAINSAQSSMDNFIICLKFTYLIELQDFPGYEKLDKLLLKYNPSLANMSVSEEVKEAFPKNKA